jgi:microsomal dipeptidase-like Zn-dependent dipeptidase
VRDDVKEVIDVIAKNDMVLASGHLHVSETWLVFEEAKRRGVKRIVLTHPEDIVDATMNDVKGLATMGAFVEHSLCMFVEGSKFKTCSAEDLRRHIDAAGVDQTVLCSDLGQTGTISRLEGFRRGIKLCMDLGYDDDQIRKMVSLNAARMLGIEADLAAA